MFNSPSAVVSSMRSLRARATLGLLASIAIADGRSLAQQDRPDVESDGRFLLVTRDARVRDVRLAAISDQSVVVMDDDRGWSTIDLASCVALLAQDRAESSMRPGRGARGLIILADGQRLPGEAVIGGANPSDTLAWNHPWLGRLDVRFDRIESVLLNIDAVAPAPADADVVITVNGDRQEGFVTAISENITLDVGEGAERHAMEIPLERVAAITMVAPRTPGSGRRVWLTEGTVLDVRSIAVGDDGYVRMTGGWLEPKAGGASNEVGLGANRPSATPPRVGLSDIEAMLFDRAALTPLASLQPSRVEGPATRYVLPRPVVLDPDAALGLSSIEYSGPIITRYALPVGAARLIADAELPRGMREWGDCELVVRSDDQEVFRAHLTGQSPTARVNVPLSGRELTIEIAAGAHGPVQDLVRLHRPMLLTGK